MGEHFEVMFGTQAPSRRHSWSEKAGSAGSPLAHTPGRSASTPLSQRASVGHFVQFSALKVYVPAVMGRRF